MDLKHFKKNTSKQALIMLGKKNYKSLKYLCFSNSQILGKSEKYSR